ncbi:MAG: glycosyltransferase family 2 protein [Lachnospiraceae bacterium]|nr:glycosyltransferase family 2 protein [Lachnospiraceae bacterium]
MIDILLATYNGEKFIKELLNSLLVQKCEEDFCIRIRDDGSKDATFKILTEYQQQYPEKIFVKENSAPTGSAKCNFFKLLEDATGDYIMFCDQDDIWEEHKVQITIDAMKKQEKGNSTCPLLVCTDLKIINEKKEILSTSFRNYMNLEGDGKLRRLILQNNVTGCTMMVNKPLLNLMKRKVKVEDILMHDHYAAILASLFGNIVYLEEAPILYRQHADNSVGAKDAKSLSYLLGRWKRGKKQYQKDLFASARQVKEILNCFSHEKMDENSRKLLEEYAKIEKMGKLQRMHFYLKYKVFKYGWIRCVMGFVWG